MRLEPGRNPDKELQLLRRRLAQQLLLALALIVAGAAGFRIIDPNASMIDAVYMTVITLTTVGYEEIIDLTTHPFGRVFTMVLLMTGVGVAALFASTATALILEGHLGHAFWRRRVERQIARLRGHYVVCGSSNTAVQVARELERTGRDAVVVCDVPERLEPLQQALPESQVVHGDPTLDDVLRGAGIERAAGLVACTEGDKDNLVITLTARQLSPVLRIIAQASEPAMEQKLRNVGADGVVSPSTIGALRLASELVRPTVVGFLDEMLRDRDRNLRIEEVPIPDASPLVGRALGSIDFRNLSDALLLASRGADGRWIYNPPPEHVLAAAQTLIVMGSPADVRRLRAHIEGTAPGGED